MAPSLKQLQLGVNVFRSIQEINKSSGVAVSDGVTKVFDDAQGIDAQGSMEIQKDQCSSAWVKTERTPLGDDTEILGECQCYRLVIYELLLVIAFDTVATSVQMSDADSRRFHGPDKAGDPNQQPYAPEPDLPGAGEWMALISDHDLRPLELFQWMRRTRTRTKFVKGSCREIQRLDDIMDVMILPNRFEKQVINAALQAPGCDLGGLQFCP
ncbi:hypothetical protein A6R68_16541 [Neotoma lepida]|uniref:Uncharacterized protein n=1 Tax=Neotoma lepida TaxID=56216 RepID=A0A1A6HFJ3_NEOLE|nr:hypothetical protein A6R68_16541 [Neotoma lepida]